MELRIRKEKTKMAALIKMFLDTMQNPELLDLLKPYGYDQEKWHEGTRLIKIAEDSIKEQKLKKKQSKSATIELNRFLNELRTIYSTDRQLVRTVLKSEPEYYRLLRLNGKLPGTKSELVEMINQFYETISAHDFLMEKAALVSITKEHIATVLHLAKKAKELNTRADQSHLIKVQATIKKNNDFARLISWNSQLKLVTSVAIKRAQVKVTEKVDQNLIRSITGRVF